MLLKEKLEWYVYSSRNTKGYQQLSKLERSKDGSFPGDVGESMALLMLWFWISITQDCKRIHLYYFNLLHLWWYYGHPFHTVLMGLSRQEYWSGLAFLSPVDHFANKGLFSQGYGFSSGHVWMWELDYKESWVQKNWCFWTVVLEKTLESPLDCKEIQPVHPKGNQSWVFIGRTDAEAETPILWPPDVKSWLIWKDPDVGKDWGQWEKGTTENEMVGWHHRLNGHEFG